MVHGNEQKVSMVDRVFVVVPTMNEEGNISQLIEGIMSAKNSLYLVVVDGGSLDSTRKIIYSHPHFGSRIFLLSQEERGGGIGPAYLQGFNFALSQDADRIVQMDADGSHSPSEIALLIGEDEDLVIGSRWVKGGQVKNWPIRRWLLSRISNLLIRLTILPQVKDSTSGFRCMRRAFVEKVISQPSAPRGFAFQVSNTLLAKNLFFTIREKPICFSERLAGESKISSKIVFESFGWLLRATVKQIRGDNC
jgi:dolichol-phosphate mannosyltransferase